MRLLLNGRLTSIEEARIAPQDRGVTLGDGLYETIRVQDGAMRRWPAHLARLTAGAAALGLRLPPQNIGAAIAGLLAAEDVTDGVLRLTVTRGPGPRGLLPPAHPTPTWMVTIHPPAPPAGPAQAIIAQSTRRNEFSPTARFKTLSALDNVVARQEAATRGADDGLLLNSQGRLAESSLANLFVVIAGQLVTPPVSEGALPGVFRASLLEAETVVQRPLTPTDLIAADEAFLTNANGVRALVAVDGTAIGDGQPGPHTLRLQQSDA